MMQGMGLKSLKKHPAVSCFMFKVFSGWQRRIINDDFFENLYNTKKRHFITLFSIIFKISQKQLIPLYFCTILGMGGAFYYTMRLATRNPDVTWAHHDNPEPWQHYADKQYKVNEDECSSNSKFYSMFLFPVLLSNQRLLQNWKPSSKILRNFWKWLVQ